ncbi:hypothetical protein ACIP17_29715 [Streptomyces iakyrus]|uniref:MmyB family transcriptional regulator n=1 Tax=Streptomyces iakyrus TaxID=68219 RepID=UPI0037F15881
MKGRPTQPTDPPAGGWHVRSGEVLGEELVEPVEGDEVLAVVQVDVVRARDFFVEWEAGAAATVALLRAEAGREPDDRALRERIGELSTTGADFRTMWAAHDVRIRHEGIITWSTPRSASWS